MMSFDPYEPDEPELAVEAFALRRGQARDFAHIFIACARFLGVPARFVGGYRAADEAGGEAGAHAWAEAHIPRLGWVAFDPTISICADDRYVRVVVGFDGQDGAFVRSAHGSARGQGRDRDPGRAGRPADPGVRGIGERRHPRAAPNVCFQRPAAPQFKHPFVSGLLVVALPTSRPA